MVSFLDGEWWDEARLRGKESVAKEAFEKESEGRRNSCC